MKKRIVSFGKVWMFSTFGASSETWKIELDHKDTDQTAIIMQYGLLKYAGMPYGLENAPTTSRCAMDVILVSVK